MAHGRQTSNDKILSGADELMTSPCSNSYVCQKTKAGATVTKSPNKKKNMAWLIYIEVQSKYDNKLQKLYVK